jgi:hypothetical protein
VPKSTETRKTRKARRRTRDKIEGANTQGTLSIMATTVIKVNMEGSQGSELDIAKAIVEFRLAVGALECNTERINWYWYFLGQYELFRKAPTHFTLEDIVAATHQARLYLDPTRL